MAKSSGRNNAKFLRRTLRRLKHVLHIDAIYILPLLNVNRRSWEEAAFIDCAGDENFPSTMLHATFSACYFYITKEGSHTSLHLFFRNAHALTSVISHAKASQIKISTEGRSLHSAPLNKSILCWCTAFCRLFVVDSDTKTSSIGDGEPMNRSQIDVVLNKTVFYLRAI